MEAWSPVPLRATAHQTKSTGKDLERAVVILIVAGIYVAHSLRLPIAYWVPIVYGSWTMLRMLGWHRISEVITLFWDIIFKGIYTRDYIWLHLCAMICFQTLKGNETIPSSTLPTRATSEVSSTSSIHGNWNENQDHGQTQTLKGRVCWKTSVCQP